MEREVDCGLPQSRLIRKNKPMSDTSINATKSWQLAQAQTMIDLFTAARGRAPNTKDELGQFLEEECAAGRISDS